MSIVSAAGQGIKYASEGSASFRQAANTLGTFVSSPPSADYSGVISVDGAKTGREVEIRRKLAAIQTELADVEKGYGWSQASEDSVTSWVVNPALQGCRKIGDSVKNPSMATDIGVDTCKATAGVLQTVANLGPQVLVTGPLEAINALETAVRWLKGKIDQKQKADKLQAEIDEVKGELYNEYARQKVENLDTVRSNNSAIRAHNEALMRGTPLDKYADPYYDQPWILDEQVGQL